MSAGWMRQLETDPRPIARKPTREHAAAHQNEVVPLGEEQRTEPSEPGHQPRFREPRWKQQFHEHRLV